MALNEDAWPLRRHPRVSQTLLFRGCARYFWVTPVVSDQATLCGPVRRAEEEHKYRGWLCVAALFWVRVVMHFNRRGLVGGPTP